ncbi:MAG TPA: hypothetical protein VGE63_01845 [Candidatus Paceibacterota bacterium]
MRRFIQFVVLIGMPFISDAQSKNIISQGRLTATFKSVLFDQVDDIKPEINTQVDSLVYQLGAEGEAFLNQISILYGFSLARYWNQDEFIAHVAYLQGSGQLSQKAPSLFLIELPSKSITLGMIHWCRGAWMYSLLKPTEVKVLPSATRLYFLKSNNKVLVAN